MNETLIVPQEAIGERADKFVARMLPDNSRAFWQKQFGHGYVTQNGVVLKNKSAIGPAPIEVLFPEHVVSALDLPVLYEDNDVMVINKPPGVLTHAKGTLNDEATVADFVRPHTTDEPDSDRSGIVHRLDRDTSGVIIAAKTPEAKAWLQAQFAERKVKKTYVALVEGQVTPPEAILRLPLERNPKEPQKFRVGAAGKPAETAYTVKEQLPRHTLVELRPLTGRTHQLRVHMAYLGHPIVGDRFYGTPSDERLFLHAATLEITLPNLERKTFSAPLPTDLTNELIRKR